jgi:hypothetical protein
MFTLFQDGSKVIQIIKYFVIFCFIAGRCFAADHYVDCDLDTGSENGTSWADAWHHPDDMTGISAGDTVYFSGDENGTTCNMTQRFSSITGYADGTGNEARVTYKIGQDSGHDGIVTFDLSNADYKWMFSNVNNITFSGDTGDDERHFIITGGHMWQITGGTSVNCTYEYFSNTFTSDYNQYRGMTSEQNIEIANSYMENANLTEGPTLALQCTTGATDYDEIRIHHNEFVTFYSTDGTIGGPDHLSGGGDGFSIYNNTFTARLNNSYTGTDHQDVWQTNAGLKYCKFYDNKVINTLNYAIFLNELNDSCDHQHWRIYNNLILLDDEDLTAGSRGGIVISDGTAPACDMQDIIVANNTIVDFDNLSAYSCIITFAETNDYTDIYFYNNLSANSPDIKYPDNIDGSIVTSGTPANGITVVNNLQINTTEAASYFIEYSEYGGLSNNYKLSQSATTLIGQGTDLSSYFTTDIDGTTRSVPPDIGAYEYQPATISGTSF